LEYKIEKRMSKLYIIPTPIGNLDDITIRSINLLNSVDLLLAEDTRKTSILLKHHNIKNKELRSYHQYNEHKIKENIINKLLSGISVGIVSDAGTPGICDAGYLIIKEAIKHNIDVECLPGATAFVPALISSGLPCDNFVFLGFLPHKKGKEKTIRYISQEDKTIVFYESPYRIRKTIELLDKYIDNTREVVIVRELTKIYEEKIRGNTKELLELLYNNPIKGEIVVVVSGKK